MLLSALLITALGTGFAYAYDSPYMMAGGKGDKAKGKKVYDKNCATCHGAAGKGDGPASKSLNPKPADFSKGALKYSKNDAEMLAFIKKGKGAMPSWKSLPEQDLLNVIAYVRSLKK